MLTRKATGTNFSVFNLTRLTLGVSNLLTRLSRRLKDCEVLCGILVIL